LLTPFIVALDLIISLFSPAAYARSARTAQRARQARVICAALRRRASRGAPRCGNMRQHGTRRSSRAAQRLPPPLLPPDAAAATLAANALPEDAPPRSRRAIDAARNARATCCRCRARASMPRAARDARRRARAAIRCHARRGVMSLQCSDASGAFRFCRAARCSRCALPPPRVPSDYFRFHFRFVCRCRFSPPLIFIIAPPISAIACQSCCH